MSTINELAINVPCTYCGAEEGHRCVTKSGAVVTGFQHSARWRTVQPIWLDGFAEGQRDIIVALDSEGDWGERHIAARRRKLMGGTR